MDVALHTPGAMTQANFLEWECHAAGWYDYDRRRPVAMTGGSPSHARIVARLIRAVLHALDLDRFDMLTGTGSVCPGGGVQYPDRMAVPLDTIGAAKLVRGPAVLFEVLEPNARGLGPLD